MIKALLWNEWRQKRMTIIFLALLTIVFWGTIYLLYKLDINRDTLTSLMTAVIFGLPVLYCVTLANSPEVESQSKTITLLQGLPIVPGIIYWTKYLFSFAATILLCGIIIVIFLSTFGLKSCMEIMNIESLGMMSYYPLLLWLLHSSIFFCSTLTQDSPNSIIGLLVCPVLFISSMSLLPLIFIFTAEVNALDSIIFMDISSVILSVVLIISGWLLYTRRVLRGRSILKPILLLIAIFVILPGSIFGTTYLWTTYELKMAEKRVPTKNIRNFMFQQFIVYPNKFQDVNPELEELTKHYRTSMGNSDFNKAWKYFFSTGNNLFSKVDPIDVVKPRNNQSRQKAEVMLNSPQMAKLMDKVNEINKIPDAGIKFSTHESKTLTAMFHIEQVSEFLLRRNIICHYADKKAEIPNNLKMALHFVSFLKPHKSGHSKWLQLDILHRIVEKTIKNARYIPSWHQMKKLSTSGNPTSILLMRQNLSEQWRNSPNSMIKACLGKINGFVFPHSSFIEYKNRDQWFYPALIPRTQHILSRHLNAIASYYSLVKKNYQTECFKDLKEQHDAFTKECLNKRTAPSEVTAYYYLNTLIDLNTVFLAVYTYYLEHGKCPDNLQQLAPEILPKVPTASFTGKPFKYYHSKTAFYVSTDDMKPYYNTYPELGISYRIPGTKGGKHE